MPEDDVIRTIRFRREVWEKMQELVDQFDRSPNWIANKLVEDYGKTPVPFSTQLKTFPEPVPDAGVSTYRATLEFQLPAMMWSDAQAYELFFECLSVLKEYAPNKQEAYGQIDAVRPMVYNPRMADVALPGADALHKHNKENRTQEELFGTNSPPAGVVIKDGTSSPFTATPRELDDAAADALGEAYKGKPDLPEPEPWWSKEDQDDWDARTGAPHPEESADYQVTH